MPTPEDKARENIDEARASRFDTHPSAAVHRRIGETLADYVQRQPGFAE